MYVLMLLHGLARITGPPKFWKYFVGPGIVFVLDKVVSLRTKYMALDILETELLPSDVLKVKFYRPPNFKYLSGQWVRLNCTALRSTEYNSFTLTSAPHENFLSCHIKAQGHWTWKLRNFFDPSNIDPEFHQPKVRPTPVRQRPPSPLNDARSRFADTPRGTVRRREPRLVQVRGGRHGRRRHWRHAVRVHTERSGVRHVDQPLFRGVLQKSTCVFRPFRFVSVFVIRFRLPVRKVYFLWICPSHKHFEWFIDVLRDVEKKDVTNVLEIHIFITQFFHKFDLRTTMLVSTACPAQPRSGTTKPRFSFCPQYICENHFQRLSKMSMFTGLKAVNHFGRPDMSSFLKFVQKKHSYVSVSYSNAVPWFRP